MKLVFDESGNTGCVLKKEEILNFQAQPTFAIGAVVVQSDEDERKLIEKYNEFKKLFQVNGEIKGSDLLTRKRNKELSYFLNHILDSTHFHINIYDKRFYMATLLLVGLMGTEYKDKCVDNYYQMASVLSLQDDNFFIRYISYIEQPSAAALYSFLKYLLAYPYRYIEAEDNIVKIAAEIIIRNHDEQWFYDDFMTFGWYDDPKQTHVINLNALSELIYTIKNEYGVSNNEILFIHDHIEQFESTFISELNECNIKIDFSDSQTNILLQIADNAVSITRHAYDNMRKHYCNKDEWAADSEWNMTLAANIYGQLTSHHIKYTVPLCDWAASLCTELMFSKSYPRQQRNNFYFNYHYKLIMQKILSDMQLMHRSPEKIFKTMKE